MTRDVYVQKIVPVGFLFAIVLWLGNFGDQLSVAFIQMVKALMPCVVYLVGVAFKVESFKTRVMANMVAIAVGVSIASYGELNFHAFGFALLMASIVCEAVRVVSIQLLLTAADIKLNSVTTLYYVSPACFAFLTVPFVFLELPKLLAADDVNVNPAVLLSNATLAFALNVSVYLLIGKTSALTMNVAGVIKDWILIFISSMLFDAPISATQLSGYLLAFAVVCYYSYTEFEREEASAAGAGAGDGGKEMQQKPPRRGPRSFRVCCRRVTLGRENRRDVGVAESRRVAALPGRGDARATILARLTTPPRRRRFRAPRSWNPTSSSYTRSRTRLSESVSFSKSNGHPPTAGGSRGGRGYRCASACAP